MKNGRGIVLFPSILVIIITLILPALMRGQTSSAKTEDLIRRSDIIVVGKVGKISSEWMENKRMIVTRVEVAVDQTIKGETQGGKITILVPGGEIDGVGEWYSHTARFSEQEELVVFAEQAGSGRLRVSGGEDGKLALTRDKVTGQRIVPDFGTLDQLTTQIRTTVKMQEQETLQKPQ